LAAHDVPLRGWCTDALRILAASRLAHARATVVHNADVPSPLPKAMNRASKLSRFMLTPFHAQR
jgi:hypothetical protein